MKLLDTVLARMLRERNRAPVRVKRTLNLRQQVLAAPAIFNRATRRAVGLLSKFWRWDMQVLGWVQPAPRYIRRHYKADQRIEPADALPYDVYGAFTHPKTRRQRKARARILAIARERGL